MLCCFCSALPPEVGGLYCRIVQTGSSRLCIIYSDINFQPHVYSKTILFKLIYELDKHKTWIRFFLYVINLGHFCTMPHWFFLSMGPSHLHNVFVRCPEMFLKWTCVLPHDQMDMTLPFDFEKIVSFVVKFALKFCNLPDFGPSSDSSTWMELFRKNHMTLHKGGIQEGGSCNTSV